MKMPSIVKPVTASIAVTMLWGLSGVNGDAKTRPWKAVMRRMSGHGSRRHPRLRN